MIDLPHPDRPMHRRGGCLGRLAWLALIVLLLGAAGGGYLWFSKPTYWKTYDRADPQLARQAESLEKRLPTEITQVRPLGEPWRITLRQDEINGWIATRLPKWMANQRSLLKQYKLPSRMPEEIRQIMVAIEPTFLALAARIEDADISQVLSMEFRPFIGEHGLARLEMTALKGGRLWLPQGLIERVIRKFGSVEQAESRLLVKFRRQLRETDLAWPADEHRLVEIMNIELTGGAATVTCRTVLKKDAVANGPWQSDKLAPARPPADRPSPAPLASPGTGR